MSTIAVANLNKIGAGWSVLETLGKITRIVTTNSACLFLIGYVALAGYFDVFGLEIWALDLPSYTFPLWSVMTIRPLEWLFLLIAVASVLPWQRISSTFQSTSASRLAPKAVLASLANALALRALVIIP